MSKEQKSKAAYFAYIDRTNPALKDTVEVEWVEINDQGNDSLGRMMVTQEDFWNLSREELWELWQKWQEDQVKDLEGDPGVVGVGPVDQGL